jgi:hypothetical protein
MSALRRYAIATAVVLQMAGIADEERRIRSFCGPERGTKLIACEAA